jgi:hypothetical protein
MFASLLLNVLKTVIASVSFKSLKQSLGSRSVLMPQNFRTFLPSVKDISHNYFDWLNLENEVGSKFTSTNQLCVLVTLRH